MKTEYEVKTAPRSTAIPHYYVKYDSKLRYVHCNRAREDCY